ARKDDLFRVAAGAERAEELALRDDVGARAEPEQRPQHAQVRVGLDAVANWKADHESLLADHVELQNDHSFTTHKVRGLEVLLETAKEDREKYRIVSEDAELKV